MAPYIRLKMKLEKKGHFSYQRCELGRCPGIAHWVERIPYRLSPERSDLGLITASGHLLPVLLSISHTFLSISLYNKAGKCNKKKEKSCDGSAWCFQKLVYNNLTLSHFLSDSDRTGQGTTCISGNSYQYTIQLVNFNTEFGSGYQGRQEQVRFLLEVLILFLLVGVVEFTAILKYLDNVFAFWVLSVGSRRGNTIYLSCDEASCSNYSSYFKIRLKTKADHNICSLPMQSSLVLCDHQWSVRD